MYLLITLAVVLVVPVGGVRAVGRCPLRDVVAVRLVEQFENVFAAFDALRRNGYTSPEYSPQWRARAEKAEAERDALAAQITEALQLFARLEERAGGWPQEVCEAHATLSAPASDVLAAHDRRVRAEALRWAAHNMPAAGCGAHSIYPWLRAEADRIEHTNP
jgi:CelD/BcsL family acetyltransferase involved in cellulose biosynthesis